MYSLMSVFQLKSELRRRNASTTGKKADLIERLEAYDRNLNFGADCDIQEDPTYKVPALEKFRDINADSPLPSLSKHAIQLYFERFNSKPQGEILYESRHLLTARFCSESDNIYIRGQCKASMKKVAYVVDAKLSQEGIEESHCECAAGSGINACCKHVSVLLCAVHDIVHNKMIKLHQSCTQTLMTFNQPKKVFYNSPIAAQNFPSKRKRTCNYSPLKEKDVMPNYTDYVRNLAIGYGESTMPILQTIPPANPHGIEWDHYPCLKKSPQETLLENLLLKNVTSAQIADVERNTRDQASSPEWHERRSCRITASMFYSVCHSKSYSTALLQRIFAPKTVHTRAIIHGVTNEVVALSQYELYLGVLVEKCGLFISAEYPFLGASPDGFLGEDTIIEIKCPYSSRKSLINEITVPYLYNNNGELALKKKHPYYAQVQGQLYCTGRQYCNFIVYTFVDMKVIFINKDDSYINEMLNNLINFYIHHLEPAILNKYMYKDYLKVKKNRYNVVQFFIYFAS
ncbi:hypothetical protein ABMA27_011961 [Loxostege sticticalis]|uniref:SWIM-type domain-containing protein n=1 Tax=Loxostege sticticalis TaxID=481309 RepID=A0ABR3II74_LOXSC